jgi:folate-binding protein YgfZ
MSLTTDSRKPISAPDLAVLTIAGADAANFLQGYLTCNLDSLEPNIGLPMAYCNLKGRVLANGWACGSPEKIELFIHASVADTLSTALSKYLLFSKSKLDRYPEKLTIATHRTPGNAIKLLPGNWSLTKTPGVTVDGHLDHLCIEAGFTLVSQRISEKFLPQMLGLTTIGAVNFDKGCYLGQEVVARAQHRGVVKRHVRRFAFTGTRPQVGDQLYPQGVVVMSVTLKDNEGLALVVTNSKASSLKSENCKLDLA